jgi:hypothetical protein
VDKQAHRDHIKKAELSENPDFEKLELWVEIQKQVKILREELESEDKTSSRVQSSISTNTNTNTNTFELSSRPRVGMESLMRYRDELDALLHGRRAVLTPSERSIAAVTGQF